MAFNLTLGPVGLNAQVKEISGSTFYRSQIDELITIDKIAVLPFTDNLEGIYARPLESHLLELLKQDHHWDLYNINPVGPLLSPIEIRQDPKVAQKISKDISDAQAFFSAKISKGPNGISMDLSLFLTKDGKLFASQELKNSSRFHIEDLKRELESLLKKIKKQVPYSGRILSRDKNRVTVNLGLRDGVVPNQVIPIVQILKLNRHPKFHFLINTEKEILGKVKLLKIEDTLSFGVILTEREKGAIQVGAKISGLEFVEYENVDSLNPDASIGNRPDKNITFGKNPKEWVPQNPPTFGRASVEFGLGMYQASTKLRDASNTTYSAENPYYPGVGVEGELWLTNLWAMHFGLSQGIIPIDNSSGSSPGELSQSLSKYEFLFGYYIRMGAQGIWDPWVELLAGYSSYRLFVDDSNPTTFTTAEYSGLKFGIKGQFPVSDDKKWFAGGQLYFHYEPSLNETPVTSGSGRNNTINEFGAWGAYQFRNHIQLYGGVDFSLYSTSFSGSGSRSSDASSSSQRHIVFNGGVHFFF